MIKFMMRGLFKTGKTKIDWESAEGLSASIKSTSGIS